MRNMTEIFKKNDNVKVSSPEQLNDYIRVTTPSVWLMLFVLLIMLAGLILWSIFGTVSAVGSDGEVREIHPIVLITN